MSDTEIQQLWYTWSEYGYGTLNAGGYRIRAASPQLIEADGIRRLDYYARYELPPGTNLYDPRLVYEPETKSELTLISLMYLNVPSARPSGNENILVNIVYTGQDARGRPGVFFAHILANLPDTFTVKDAISLWRSNFWRTSNPSPEEYGLSIAPVFFKDLQKKYNQSIFHNVATDDSTFQNHLRFLILAYLLQQYLLENRQQQLNQLEVEIKSLDKQLKNLKAQGKNKKDIASIQKTYDGRQQQLQREQASTVPRIYLAISPDELAALIAQLADRLPAQLYQTLTFSTYEQNILKSPCRIVGTCPSPSPMSGIILPDTLPTECYVTGIALNCYTNSQDNLTAWIDSVYPSDQSIKYITRCADFLTKTQTSHTLLQYLLKVANERENTLTVQSFLKLFENIIVIPSELTPSGIINIFRQRDVERLQNVVVRERVIDMIVKEEQWFTSELAPVVKEFAQDPRMASIVNSFATEIIEVMHRDSLHEQDRQPFTIRFELFKCLISTISSPKTLLLNTLFTDPRSCKFIMQDRQLHIDLLAFAVFALTPPEQYTEIVRSLLTWDSEQYIALLRDVNVRITNLSKNASLPIRWRYVIWQDQLSKLRYNDTPEYKSIRKHLLFEAQNLPIAAEEENLRPLLTHPALNEDNFVSLLPLRLSPRYKAIAIESLNEHTPLQFAPATIANFAIHHEQLAELIQEQAAASPPGSPYRNAIIEFYLKIANSGYEYIGKLLDVWHDDTILLTKDEVQELIDRTSLDTQELELLLVTYKEKYKELGEDFLLDFYSRICEENSVNSGFLAVLLLKDKPVQQVTMEGLLKGLLSQVHLAISEIEAFFRESGHTYISRYPQSLVLWQLFEQLQQTSSPIFTSILKEWLSVWREQKPGSQQDITIINYYKDAVKNKQIVGQEKYKLLDSWLKTNLPPDDLDRVYEAPFGASLLNDEEASWIAFRWGKRYLENYHSTNSSIPKSLKKCFLSYLQNFEAAHLSSQAKGAGVHQQMLQIIANSQQLDSKIKDMARDWLTLEKFFKQPASPMKGKMGKFSQAFQLLLTAQHPPTSKSQESLLDQAIKNIPVVDDDRLLVVILSEIDNLSENVKVDLRWRLLWGMAKQAGEHYQQGKLDLLLPYIQVLPCWNDLFVEIPENNLSKSIFEIWDVLLQSVPPDISTQQEVVTAISKHVGSMKQTAGWKNEISRMWRKYEDDYYAHNGATDVIAPQTHVTSSPSTMEGVAQESNVAVRHFPLLPWKGFLMQWWLRWRVSHVRGAKKLTKLWEKHHGFLKNYPDVLKEDAWKRLKLAYEFHVMHKYLENFKNSNDADAQKARRVLIAIDDDIKKFENGISQKKHPLLNIDEGNFVKGIRNELEQIESPTQQYSQEANTLSAWNKE